MKKILLLIAGIGLLCAAVSCSGDDEPDVPQRGDGVFVVNTSMINHMVNISNGQVLGVSSTHNKLTIDTVNHMAWLELHYLDGNTEKTMKLDAAKAKPKRLGFYELESSSNPNFSGYVDFNEGAMRYRYQTPEGILVTSTMSEIFYLKTESTLTYDDTTATNKSENTMYQFNINATNQTATIMVMDIVHAKDLKRFINITANSVPYTVTTTGFAISGENLNTNAQYIAYVDSTGSSVATTDKYPFKTFNATIDLANDHLSADFMIGPSATVHATGKTYPDYSAY